MSEEEARERGLQLVPRWVPVALAMVTIVCNAGATWTAINLRTADLEKRVSAIEMDRTDKLKDYEQFKSDIRADVAEMKTDLKWIRSALERAK